MHKQKRNTKGIVEMKKLLALALALILVLSLASCGSKKEETSTDTAATTAASSTPKVDAIKAAGKLVVGTSADFAPYEFHVMVDGKDTIVGFDVALAQDIADELGVELEIVDMSFDSILIELQKGSIDLGIAGFSPDPERAETFDFSDIYYEGGQSFCIMQENADKYKSYADFAGLQVGAQSGSIQADLLTKNTPDAQAVLLTTVPDVVLELTSGKIQGAFLETAIYESYKKTYPNIMELCPVEYDVQGSAVALNKGNEDLLAVVNAVIKKDTSDGTMDKYVADANELSSQAIA